jgi:hypothetical protein
MAIVLRQDKTFVETIRFWALRWFIPLSDYENGSELYSEQPCPPATHEGCIKLLGKFVLDELPKREKRYPSQEPLHHKNYFQGHRANVLPSTVKRGPYQL